MTGAAKDAPDGVGSLACNSHISLSAFRQNLRRTQSTSVQHCSRWSHHLSVLQTAFYPGTVPVELPFKGRSATKALYDVLQFLQSPAGTRWQTLYIKWLRIEGPIGTNLGGKITECVAWLICRASFGEAALSHAEYRCRVTQVTAASDCCEWVLTSVAYTCRLQ
jgi:hypothetical protein